jgi:uncharacterized protein YbjT (DUF2867 family)
VAQRLVALTGATGFLGRHVGVALAAGGLRVRILTRREAAHPLWRDFTPEVVAGGLEDVAALARLVAGAAVVVHLAGLTRGRSRGEFLRVNRDGSRRLAEAVLSHASASHLIGISSLAARAPQLSAYAESKQAGERALMEVFGEKRLTILRPPVIYGPWDVATLGIFRAAAGRIVPVPCVPGARVAMIHVEDAAAAIAALAACTGAAGGGRWALADANPGGYSLRDILEAAASALGQAPRFLPVPRAAVLLAGQAAGLAGLLRGRPAYFNAGKAREMLHPDWSVRPDELLPVNIARPQTGLREGFTTTAAWYRQAGWLS